MRTLLRPSSLALVALLGLAMALPAAAQWKWRDTGGRVQYSDMPPPSGTSEQDILQRPAAAARRAGSAGVPALVASAASGSAAPPLVAGRASDPALEARRRQAEQELAAKKQVEEQKLAAARAENCARAKEAKRTVDSGVRITRTNAQGEREYLDDAARATEGRRAQQSINSDCR